MMQKRNYRRGIAIEMAIGMMFLVIALSIILLTVSSLQIQNQKNDLDAYEKTVLGYTVTDMALADTASGSVEINKKTYSVVKTDAYIYEIREGESIVYTVTTDENGKIASFEKQ